MEHQAGSVSHFSQHPDVLFLDLEISHAGNILDIGAVRGKNNLHTKSGSKKALLELAEFAEGAAVVVGHNIIEHDLKHLSLKSQNHPILQLPVIDTLTLSPICFPENPYHRLLKNYKLVRDSLSDPVADCRLCRQLFQEEIEVLENLQATAPEMASFYRSCLLSEPSEAVLQSGLSILFDKLEIQKQSGNWHSVFKNSVKDLVCIKSLANHLAATPSPHPQLAYTLSWLKVAGANSVLPRWVQYKYPDLDLLLHNLRSLTCDRQDCSWCRTIHNPQKQLQNYFGFEDFRNEPAREDGQSLQAAIVQAGMEDRSILAILPTGGGKSLCFQLPALVRHQRLGVLTIVVSPLQALMKDQVDNLRRYTGMHSAIDTINGMLTLPERGAVFEKIVLGDTALLYVSPEQLRNKRFKEAISKRKIGCWVFDEAHCLSKWGHDFRPDYLYAGRFIRELAKVQREDQPPPIACFTATAKLDVKEELLDYFDKQLGVQLEEFDGGTARTNLEYSVRIVSEHEKVTAAHELLTEHIPGEKDGCAVVFCATRKNAKEMAERLIQLGWPAAHFHAGISVDDKNTVLEAFNQGEIRVICATNAFGMGVDKPDIRLVIHADIPGSLENYVQEAGRGGRDQLPAQCVLLYNPGDGEKGGDIDLQFSLDAMGRISQFDIRNILKGVRIEQKSSSKKSGEKPHVFLSADEILRNISTSFEDENPENRRTKVFTAIANLENTQFLERNENQNRVFQGVPLIPTMEEARRVIAKQDLSPFAQCAWIAIYEKFLNLPQDSQPNAEDFAMLAELAPLCGKKEGKESVAPIVVVFRILNQMARSEVGLIKKDTLFTAVLRYGVANNAKIAFERLSQMEKAALKILQELAPDVQTEETYPLHVNTLATKLQQEGFENCLAEHLHRLLEILRLDGTGLADGKGSILPKAMGQGRYLVKLQRTWEDLRTLSRKRLLVAQAILEVLYRKIPKETPFSAKVLVKFEESDLIAAIANDLVLSSEINSNRFHEAIEHGLRYLHLSRIIRLENGRALITQAMRLDLLQDDQRRIYNKSDHQPLDVHYQEKNLQIHVMAEYAKLGAEAIKKAVNFVLDYFNLDKEEFVKKYFSDRKKLIQMATSEAAYARIVESLNNPYQQSIVCEPASTNLLILAGPGSGKTRVVAHRCAHLLTVDRVPARQLLVLCYNRSAASQLRKRIRNLAGPDAHGITIATFHSLAMQLVGISPKDAYKAGSEPPDFDQILQTATNLLEGKHEIAGLNDEQILNSLIGNWSHILIDEYQDIDQQQYDLISAIAGRTRENPDTKLSILAVGDDDQNIYAFRNTSTRFIRQFQEDYSAKILHLLENYRSTQSIISCSNTLIARNQDRMKVEHPIRINHSRSKDATGSPVRILGVVNSSQQLANLASELKKLDSEEFSQTAIVGRTRRQLFQARAILEYFDLPIRWACDPVQLPPIHRIREFQSALQILKTRSGDFASATEIMDLVFSVESLEGNQWQQILIQILEDWRNEVGNHPRLVDDCIDFLHNSLLYQGKELTFGKGIHLGTAHGIKGLEFKNVYILDGDWEASTIHLEDERRLYYVAMTRAMENLTLFQRSDCSNSFIQELKQSGEVSFINEKTQTDFPKEILQHRYDLLSMKELFMDLGGRNPTVNQQISQLKTGDPLQLGLLHDRASVFDVQGKHVATLSQQYSEEWIPWLDHVHSARVFAIVTRTLEDCRAEYREKCKIENWEIPIVEVTWIDDYQE